MYGDFVAVVAVATLVFERGKIPRDTGN